MENFTSKLEQVQVREEEAKGEELFAGKLPIEDDRVRYTEKQFV